MKSKKSCFDCATGRMELRRFAPMWILYTMVLFVTTALNFAGVEKYPVNRLNVLHDYVFLMAVCNFLYAFALAEVLFGDLYNPRLCYAIHALPITRGGFFGTQVVLGIMGSLIPNLMNSALLLFFIPAYRITVLWWLLLIQLQFLCFFGFAVLSAVCAGNRLGLMLFDGIFNFLAVLVYWFQVHVFMPLIYGLTDYSGGFLRFCPLYSMLSPGLNFTIDYNAVTAEDSAMVIKYVVRKVSLERGVWLLALWAALGIAAICLAMKLYRRRRLEFTGELVIFPQLKPVFLIIYTLICAGAAHLIPYVLNVGLASGGAYLLMLLGMVVGYYTGLMLLKRQVQVFRPDTLPAISVMIAVMIAALTVTALNPLGLGRKIPEPEEIQSIYLSPYYRSDGFTADENAEISQVLALQQEILAEHDRIESSRPLLQRLFGNENSEVPYPGNEDECSDMYYTFTMQDGSTLLRKYTVHSSSDYIEELRAIFSRPEVVLSPCSIREGNQLMTVEELLESITMVNLICTHTQPEYIDGHSQRIKDTEEIQSLMAAVLSDCESGTMAQNWLMRQGEYIEYLDIYYFSNTAQRTFSFMLDISEKNEAISGWMADHGIHDENASPEIGRIK